MAQCLLAQFPPRFWETMAWAPITSCPLVVPLAILEVSAYLHSSASERGCTLKTRKLLKKWSRIV
eukprot:3591119-Prorocentrum_lima.AAC.1